MSYGVLIIEDEAVLAKKIAKYLTQRGFETRVVDNGPAGLETLGSFLPDAVLLDFNLPGGLNGLEVLERIRQHDSSIKVIMVTGQGHVRLAVDAMKAGAYDYLSKPVILSELKLLLDRAIGQNRQEGQLSYYHEKQATRSDIEQIIGECEAIRQMRAQIARIIDAGRRLTEGAPPPVLITGETGTGKELVARALHFGGPRGKQPFIELNAATLPSHLVESEIFGYERGAFTDARERKLGLVEAADGGTLFLDEIGELDLAVQAKLLKMLEDRKVRRLGSVRDHSVDIQILTATNRSLPDMAAQGRFREDLLFRLNTLTLQVPPLRERNGDILLLARHFAQQFGQKYDKAALRISDEAAAAIMQYAWPGNVRELRNKMEQAVLLCDREEIASTHLGFQVESAPTATTATNPTGPATSQAGASTLAAMEREIIERMLTEVDGNVSKAARRLGISRDQLRYRIDKYDL
jgi:DNA-binding NtrC family response regulator